MTEKLRFCETRPVFLLTLPRLSLSVKSVGVAFCVPNGFFMSQMGLSTILKREGCNRGDTLPFSDTLVAPLPMVDSAWCLMDRKRCRSIVRDASKSYPPPPCVTANLAAERPRLE